MTVDFLVIQRIMLYTGSYTILLYALHVRNHHTRSQIGIFTHILKVTSIQRSTVNVDTRSQKNILVAITRLFTDTFSVKQGHIGIPCSSQTSQCRISYTRVIGPPCLIPLIPKYFGTDTMRTICHPIFRNTQAGHSCTTEFTLCMYHSYLFFQSQPFQRIFYSFFDRFGNIQIYGFLLRQEWKSNSECQTE